MCEDGMSETEATAKLGDPGKVAEELLAALPLGLMAEIILYRDYWKEKCGLYQRSKRNC